MIAPRTRRPVASGYYRMAAGDTTHTGEVAPTNRPSIGCRSCGAVVLDNPGGRAAHRRKHAETRAA